jgi:hypothetical protein
MAFAPREFAVSLGTEGNGWIIILAALGQGGYIEPSE